MKAPHLFKGCKLETFQGSKRLKYGNIRHFKLRSTLDLTTTPNSDTYLLKFGQDGKTLIYEHVLYR